MVTSIQVSEETKAKLLTIMGHLQSEKGTKITYEDAINYLIEQKYQIAIKRRKFAEKYFGSLNVSIAKQDIEEARNLERK